jgi:uncharacterized protein YciI
MPLWVRILRITDVPDGVGDALERHRAHLRDLRDRGRLRVAGEFRDGDGSVEIFEAKDLLEAGEIARSSPLVEEGLAAMVLREWREIDL